MTSVRADVPISQPPTSKAPTRKKRGTWLIPTGLILLSVVPILGGALRITDLAGGTVTAANERFFDSPVPVILHIVGVTVYSLLGALQFVPGLRRGRPSWHRIAGRILVPAGLLAALSALWMTLFYAIPADDGGALFVMRLIFGSGMAVSIVLGFLAIRRRDIATHRAWMTRAYAIAMGAGTQAVVLTLWLIVAGTPDGPTHAVLMGASWLINLAVAERAIRR